MGISLLAFFQWVFRYLHIQLGMHTVILAHVAFSISYVVIVVLARLRTFDVSLEEAAMDLGATEWEAFREIDAAGAGARDRGRCLCWRSPRRSPIM